MKKGSSHGLHTEALAPAVLLSQLTTGQRAQPAGTGGASTSSDFPFCFPLLLFLTNSAAVQLILFLSEDHWQRDALSVIEKKGKSKGVSHSKVKQQSEEPTHVSPSHDD